MNRRILIVVATEADKADMVEVMKSLVPEEYIERATTGKHCDFILKNGDVYKVWSAEQWNGATTCGASIDAVMYLVHPVPQYIKDHVQICLMQKEETYGGPVEGDECPSCRNGTVEFVDDEVRCRGECGAIWKLSSWMVKG